MMLSIYHLSMALRNSLIDIREIHHQFIVAAKYAIKCTKKKLNEFCSARKKRTVQSKKMSENDPSG